MSGDLGHDAEAQAEAEAGVAAAAEAEAEAGAEAEADAIAIVIVVRCCFSSFKDRGPSPVHSATPAPRRGHSLVHSATPAPRRGPSPVHSARPALSPAAWKRFIAIAMEASRRTTTASIRSDAVHAQNGKMPQGSVIPNREEGQRRKNTFCAKHVTRRGSIISGSRWLMI